MFSRLILLPLIILLLAFGLFLGGRNAAPVTLDYYFGAVEMRLAVALILAFIAGICLGALAIFLGVVVKLKYQLRKARKAESRERDLNLSRLQADPSAEAP